MLLDLVCCYSMRLTIIGNEIIKNVGKSESCMVSKLPGARSTESQRACILPHTLVAGSECRFRYHMVSPLAAAPAAYCRFLGQTG